MMQRADVITYEMDGQEHTLSICKDIQEIYSMFPETKPDLKWEFVDAEGHFHSWVDLERTTEEVEEPWFCSDCHEEHTDSHLACRKCGETVIPGRRVSKPAGYPHYITTEQYYLLDGEPISQEEFEAIKTDLIEKYSA